jgi:hypothetical protein
MSSSIPLFSSSHVILTAREYLGKVRYLPRGLSLGIEGPYIVVEELVKRVNSSV